MHRFGRCFQHLSRDDMYFVTLKTVRTSLCSLQHTIRKIVLEFLQSANNRTQSWQEIQCMVVIGTVINTILGWLSVDPFGSWCPAWDDAFVSSSGFGLPHLWYTMSTSWNVVCYKCCLRRHKSHGNRQTCCWVEVRPNPLSTDGTMNTSFAEYLSSSLFYLFLI